MKRDPTALSQKTHDVLVIGGGVYGAAIAWDASLRGLSTVLLEKGDFGGATSANSLRVIHGGLRYLQHLDFARMRDSIRERRNMSRIAPHLVHPLPCVFPLYRSWSRGRFVLSWALRINDLVSRDRNDGLAASHRLPSGRMISREECLRLVPEVRERGLSGAAVWHDCHMPNSERLTLSFVLSAARAGAMAANYCGATGLLLQGARVVGAEARDGMSGRSVAVRARVVVNAAGPWVNGIRTMLPGIPRWRMSFTKAFNLLIRRPLVRHFAVAIHRPGGPVLFMVPWRRMTLIGTAHLPFRGRVDGWEVTEREIAAFLGEIRRACPGLSIERADVVRCFAGLLPGEEFPPGSGRVRLFDRPRLVDHLSTDGVEGLLSVSGVKYTTARAVAETVVGAVFRKLGRLPQRCRTATTPLIGGGIGDLDDYLSDQVALRGADLGAETVRRLVLTYGAEYESVLRERDGDDSAAVPISARSGVLRAEVLRAVRGEMARTLADVVCRRTGTAFGDAPDEEVLAACARVMSQELGWDEFRREDEVRECRVALSRFSRQTDGPGADMAFAIGRR